MGDLDKKIDYVKTLGYDEVRYEMDKIRARINQVERLKGLQEELGEGVIPLMDVSILDNDYDKLLEELEFYEYYFNELKE